MENKYVWDEVYERGESFSELCSATENLLANKNLLYAYYPLVRLIKRNKLKIRKSIEFGAGTGQMSLILKKLGLVEDVYLVDIEKGALGIAERLFNRFGEKCKIIHADLFKINFKEDEFDLCFSGGLIEHFKEEKQDEVIKRHARIARNIIFQFPINSLTYWTIRSIISVKNKFRWPFGYEKPISTREARLLMRKNGIRIIDEDFHYLLPAIARKIKNPSKLMYNGIPSKLFKMDYSILCKKVSNLS